MNLNCTSFFAFQKVSFFEISFDFHSHKTTTLKFVYRSVYLFELVSLFANVLHWNLLPMLIEHERFNSFHDCHFFCLSAKNEPFQCNLCKLKLTVQFHHLGANRIRNSDWKIHFAFVGFSFLILLHNIFF